MLSLSRLATFVVLPLMAIMSCSSTDWFNESPDSPIEPDSVAINPRSRYVVVVGDIQTYTMRPDDDMKYLKESMDWLAAQQSFFNNIDAVIQVGDITNDNEEWQWTYGVMAMREVATAIPTIAIPGNHDYDWLKEDGDRFTVITSRYSSLFDKFPLPINKAMQIVARYEPGSLRNAIYSLQIGGRTAHVVALEFAPAPEVVEWAARHIAANSSTDCYLLTHEWLSGKGDLITKESGYAIKQFGSADKAMSPDDMWEILVRPYDNVIAVICGHNGFVASRFTPNDAGREVAQILFNLQYQENGGDSMLQLWEFPEDSDSVYTYVYNTRTHIHHPDPKSRINFSRSRARNQQ